MSIQNAQNELHRAHTAAVCGFYRDSAIIAMDAYKIASDSRSKHAPAIAEAAIKHAELMKSKLGESDAH